MKRLVLIGLVVCMTLISGVYARSGDAGRYSGEFLYFGVGGRSIAMGRAYTAVKGDIWNLYWNPAGVCDLDNPTFGFMHNQLLESSRFNYFAFSYPFKTYSLGVALGIVSYGDIDGYIVSTNGLPQQTGSFDGSDLVAQFTYSNPTFDGKLLFGATGKLVRSEIASYSATGLGADIGLIWITPVEGFTIGGVLQNIGTKLKYISEQEELPLTIKLGGAYNILNKYITISGDLIKKGDQEFDIAAGGEVRLINHLNLRAGFNSLNDVGSGLSLGMGYFNDNISVDYAYVPYGDLGNTHKFSFDYKFGYTREKQKQYPRTARIENKPPRYIANKQPQPVETAPPVMEQKPTVIELLQKGYLKVLETEYLMALKLFNDALKIKNDELGRLWLAYTYAKLQNYKAAMREYKAVLQMNPDNLNAQKALAILEKYY